MVVHLAERGAPRRKGYDPELTAADVGARLPDGLAVERPLLAGLLTAGDEAVDAVVATGLDPEHFSSQDLGAVYGVMRRMRAEQRATNLESVGDELRRAGPLGGLVDTGGLHALVAHLPPPSADADGVLGQLASLARTVGEYGTLRLGAQLAFRIARLAKAGMPPARFLQGLRAQVDALAMKAPAHVRPAEVRSLSSFVREGAVADALPPVPLFPTWTLPRTARALVLEAARSLQCPADFVAAPVLAITSGVIGRRFVLRVKTDWLEPAQLWIAVVGEPGTAKSPAMEKAREPIEALQAEAHAAATTAHEAHEAQVAQWLEAPKGDKGPKPEPPPDEEHYYTNDATTEALCRMLGGPRSRTPGLAVFEDELTRLINAFDAYRGGRGGDRQQWLRLWAGGALKSDRAGRESVYVQHPAVSLLGGVQPDLLPTLAGDIRQRDGFVERFLFVYPDTHPMGWTSETVAPVTIERLTALYQDLRAAGGERAVVDLSVEARTRFAHWSNDLAGRMAHSGGHLRGFYAKLPRQVLRLALALHCLEHAGAAATVPIAARTVEHALELGDYFLRHAVRVLARLDPAALVGQGLTARLYRALREAAGAPLAKRDLHRATGRSVKAAEMRAALDELCRLGLVEGETVKPDGGGRPAETYRLRTNELNEHTPEGAEAEGEPLPDTCDECEAPVEWFTEDGRPKCEAHADAVAVEGGR